ncbi:Hypothetical predicted protein [Paramuricea clavata]|uniref:Uncharacterized protein n=1 Tax=Paramuricea clavata TaxID=317549 RepID=A0A7D9JNP2_PARCT|nr:Hypothetical predicted protein [Paramuricea clavata]
MRLAVSHIYFNKKLDEFGQGHDDILKMMELQKIELQKTFPTTKQLQVIEMGVDSDDGNSSLTNASKAIFAQRLALIEEIPHSDLEIKFSVPVMKNCPQSSPAVQRCSKKSDDKDINNIREEVDSKGFKV